MRSSQIDDLVEFLLSRPLKWSDIVVLSGDLLEAAHSDEGKIFIKLIPNTYSIINWQSLQYPIALAISTQGDPSDEEVEQYLKDTRGPKKKTQDDGFQNDAPYIIIHLKSAPLDNPPPINSDAQSLAIDE